MQENLPHPIIVGKREYMYGKTPVTMLVTAECAFAQWQLIDSLSVNVRIPAIKQGTMTQ